MAKKIVKLGTIAALSLVASAGASLATDLKISVWGGGYAEKFEKHIVQPFEEETGISITLDGGRSTERLSKLIATRGRGADLMIISDFQMFEASKRGLLQPVDRANIPNIDRLYDFAQDPIGGGMCPAFTVVAAGIAYNKDHYETAPTSWGQLLDGSSKAKSGYPDIALSYGIPSLILFSEMNGGSIDDLAPGIKAIQEAKDDLHFFGGRDVLESINMGDVSIAPHLNIFVKKDPEATIQFTWPEEGALGLRNMICVVKGSKEAEAAEKFINYFISADVQAKWLEVSGDEPVNKDVDMSKADELPLNLLGKEALEKANFWPIDKIIAKKPEWVSMWQEEVIAN
ncbi:extracellular solute-binding protein [Rhodobacteraceae bacterium RKSG542]|uniref:extracellular solute-binding protein n=1 Tax=Pseudovibrio flavus TaxID=2529854 RepID=UPI0012BD3812|nr:extracellular solute-binding protein [Pseudovibrio flavus]MTI16507.1 extracellular solute-binding protein [Pseudovibrio flavus]